MEEMFLRWKVFPRETEADLSLYHRIDIGDWHNGEVSSRKLLTFLDGLPADSWYKQSAMKFVQEVNDEKERMHAADVGGLIFAQLTGQEVNHAQN